MPLKNHNHYKYWSAALLLACLCSLPPATRADSSPSQAVTSFTLIDTRSGQPVPGYETISNGALIDPTIVDVTHLSVRANTNPSQVGSVRFVLDANQYVHVEDTAPYALFANRGAVYYSGSFAPGQHTLSAVPYTQSHCQGLAGTALAVSFSVAAPTPTPTPQPTATPTATPSATPTPTVTPTATPTPTPSATPIPTPTPTVTPTPTPVPSATPTPTPVATPTPTITPTPTATPTVPPSPTPTPTPTPISTVTLAWTGSPSTNVTGYHVWYGVTSGNYTQRLDAGNSTNDTVSGLAPSTSYYFVVKAYDAAGQESAASNEVSFTTGASTSVSVAAATEPTTTTSNQVKSTARTGMIAAELSSTGPAVHVAASTESRKVSGLVHVAPQGQQEVTGFQVTGDKYRTVVVRALGPTLTQLGVEQALPDPVLIVRDTRGNVIASNESWRTAQPALFASGGPYHKFQPDNDSEPALAVRLPAGAYTVTVQTRSGATGVAMFEAYALD
ncbi:MAG: fibronectin type III domain-containing protein [Verrucomicrobia bacterium]|nr:fibronectin type III domain-containing protein [Verrucomicrobiota bacterium]